MTSAHRPPVAPPALVLFLLASACAGDEPAQRVPPSPNAIASAETAVSVPLTFDVPENGSTRRVHVPMVHATVGGVDTLLILDTGATDHVFTRELAERIGLALIPAEAGTDHAGAEVRSWSATENVVYDVAGASFIARTPVVIEGPPPFAGWNVGGFLSPQGIAPEQVLVLDFAANTMSIQAAFTDAEQIALDGAYPHLARQALPLVPATGDAARLLIVSAHTPSDAPLRVMLNCGGKNAEFTTALVANSDGDAPVVATGRGVSGSAVMGQSATGGVLRVGTGAVVLTDIVVRAQDASYDAQLGMPMLAGTVLVVPPRGSGTVEWWIPPNDVANKQ